MTPTETSLKTYYDLVMSGESDKQRHRIMRHILTAGRPITRHEIVDLHFYTQPGPKALDGLRPIPLQSACGRIRELLDMGYIKVESRGDCPVTGNHSEFLVPVPVEEFAEKPVNLPLF